MKVETSLLNLQLTFCSFSNCPAVSCELGPVSFPRAFPLFDDRLALCQSSMSLCIRTRSSTKLRSWSSRLLQRGTTLTNLQEITTVQGITLLNLNNLFLLHLHCSFTVGINIPCGNYKTNMWRVLPFALPTAKWHRNYVIQKINIGHRGNKILRFWFSFELFICKWSVNTGYCTFAQSEAMVINYGISQFSVRVTSVGAARSLERTVIRLVQPTTLK